MTRAWSITAARKLLSSLVRDAERGLSVTITRHGRPVAALIAFDERKRLGERRISFSTAYQDLLERFAVAELEIDPDTIFERSSEPDGGRDLPWERLGRCSPPT